MVLSLSNKCKHSKKIKSIPLLAYYIKIGAAQSVDLLKAAGDASRKWTVKDSKKLQNEVDNIAEKICYSTLK